MRKDAMDDRQFFERWIFEINLCSFAELTILLEIGNL